MLAYFFTTEGANGLAPILFSILSKHKSAQNQRVVANWWDSNSHRGDGEGTDFLSRSACRVFFHWGFSLNRSQFLSLSFSLSLPSFSTCGTLMFRGLALFSPARGGSRFIFPTGCPEPYKTPGIRGSWCIHFCSTRDFYFLRQSWEAEPTHSLRVREKRCSDSGPPCFLSSAFFARYYPRGI